MSTSPLFYSNKSVFGAGYNGQDENICENKRTKNGYSVEIGNDVWIGANVTIL